jgi:hypothetical protein
MMLSVMVVGAGAAFSDQSKIKNTEAVDACTALNIIGGYPDGSFKPEGNITRAEVTKMICVALNGGKEPNLATNATPTFSDVRTNANSAWAEKYIESCYAQGIVSGVGGGKFAPAGNVTGTQLAKMLLVSLGYKSENEGFTGNAWATNVNTIASAKGLYKDLETIDPAAALTRDSAAQMIWNALQAYEVEYKTTLVTDSKGQLTSQITVQDKVVGDNYDKITLLKDKYEAYVNIGTLVSIDGKDLTITMSNSDRAESDTHDTDFTKLGTDYSALLGQKVKVIFKNGKANDVLGVYATGDNTVYSALMNEVEKDGAKVKFGGTSYSVDNGKIKTTTVKADGTQIEEVKTVDYFNGKDLSLDTVTFVDTDDNDKIDTAIVREYVAGEVTYVSSDKITMGSTTVSSYAKSYKYADENISKDVSKDDWAVISANLYKDCKDINKATVVNGTLDGIKTKTGYQQFKIEGTWYNISETNASDVSNGDTVQAYIVNGVIVKIKSDDGKGGYPTNIAVAVSGLINGDQVRIRYFDGTSKLVTISDNTTINPQPGTAYKVSGSDASMKLESTLETGKKYNSYTYAGTGVANPDGDNDAVTISRKDVKVDDSAAVILYDGNGRSKMLTGKQYNALTKSQFGSDTNDGNVTAAFTKEKNGLTRVMMLAVKTNSMTISGQSYDNYAYVVTDNGKNKDGNAVFTIWTTDNKYVENVVWENATNSVTKGSLIGYSSIDSNNVIKDAVVIKNIDQIGKSGTTAVTSVTGGATFSDTAIYYGANRSDDSKFITVDQRKFKITADTAVLFVDSAADKDNAIGVNYTYGSTAMAKAEEYTSGSYSNNVMFIVDENGKTDDVNLKVLVIDTTGVFDGQKNNDPTTPSVEKGDYTSKWAEVKVADKNLVTYAASTRNSQTGEVTVDLTLDSTVDTVDPSKITVKKDGVRVSSPTNTTIDDGHYIFTVSGVAANDSKLSIDVAAGFVTATTVTVADVAGTTTAAGLDASADVTANNAFGLTPTVTWYNKNTKDKVKTDAPANVNVSVTPVGKTTAKKATVTLKEGTSAPTAGTYYFTVTVNGVESAVKTLTIS